MDGERGRERAPHFNVSAATRQADRIQKFTEEEVASDYDCLSVAHCRKYCNPHLLAIKSAASLFVTELDIKAWDRSRVWWIIFRGGGGKLSECVCVRTGER